MENLPEGINLNKASTPRNALGATLRPLATLYALLAEIHAFRDGNSRTRVLLLQAELTRLGGHPVLLPEFWRSVYDQNGIGELELMLLQGWCAYEHSLRNHGQSPYTGWMQEWDKKHPDQTRAAALRHTVQGRPPEGAVRLEPEDPIVAYVRELGVLMYDATGDRCLVYPTPSAIAPTASPKADVPTPTPTDVPTPTRLPGLECHGPAATEVEVDSPYAGDLGGTCTCPDGQAYHVGDKDSRGKELACVGGESGKVHSWLGLGLGLG